MAVSPSSDRLPSLNVEIDPDFEPQKRPRSCTWPLPRPELDTGKKELTDVIPEEDDGEEAVNCRTDDSKCVPSDAVVTRESKNGSGLILVEKDKTAPTGQESVDSPLSSRSQIAAGSDTCCDGAGSQQLRKSSSRRNAWGNLSYADLITKAIESSPEKRLTLSQIYDWMVRCVPYFKDKGDNNSSAGWKNSIRHNLSLHSRFIRLQNEGTGKSSWWMINPDGGKGGKGPRRRAVSMDNSSKYAKSRGRAAKKKAVTQAVQEEGHDGSPTSRGSDDLDPWTDFRSRTNSSASTLSGRLSPIPADPELGEVLDDELPLSPMLYSSPNSTPPSGRQPCPVKLPYLADLTGTMNLNDGMSDDLMDGLLDNINLTLSQQTSPRSSSCSTLQRGSSLVLDSNISGLSPPNDNYTNGVYGCLSLSGLRQLPMQTIQENTQASFSCTTLFGSQAVQNLHGCCDVMMTQLDPLISQASASASSQSFRQGIATQGCSLNRPGLLHHQPQSQNALLADWRTALSAPVKGELDLTSDTSNLAVKQKFQCFSGDASLKMGSSDSALYSSLNGGGTSLPLLSQDKFSSDLDLDSPDCDNDFTVHNELMDAEGLDVNIDCLISAQNVVSLNVDNFTNTKQAPAQNWVPS